MEDGGKLGKNHPDAKSKRRRSGKTSRGNEKFSTGHGDEFRAEVAGKDLAAGGERERTEGDWRGRSGTG